MTKEEKNIYGELYKRLLDAVENLPKEAVERASASLTRKGYDTTGYQYQFLVNVMNEVCGIENWGFDWEVIKETESVWGKGEKESVAHEITVSVKVWISMGENRMERKSVGGHQARTYADALKGAITNGLKKTLAFYGVGKKAYEGTIDEDYQPVPEVPKTAQKYQPTNIGSYGYCACGQAARLSSKGNVICPDWMAHKKEGKRYPILSSKKEVEFSENLDREQFDTMHQVTYEDVNNMR